MFRISLKDLGENRVTKDVISHSEGLAQAEYKAGVVCEEIIGYSDFFVSKVGSDGYVVTRCNVLVGSFTITKLN